MSCGIGWASWGIPEEENVAGGAGAGGVYLKDELWRRAREVWRRLVAEDGSLARRRESGMLLE